MVHGFQAVYADGLDDVDEVGEETRCVGLDRLLCIAADLSEFALGVYSWLVFAVSPIGVLEHHSSTVTDEICEWRSIEVLFKIVEGLKIGLVLSQLYLNNASYFVDDT